MEQITTKQWLHFLGKEKLQSFQDNFAQICGISLCFLDLHGEPLVVWSKLPLACDYVIKNNLERCMQERWKMIKALKGVRQAYVHSCFTGRLCFVSPVYYKDQLICVAYGGREPSREDQAGADGNRFRDMLNLLHDIFHLIHCGEHDFAKDGEDSPFHLHLRSRLSVRELEISGLLLKKYSNRDIAQALFISEKTVKTHVSNILRKLDMKDRRQLAAWEADCLKGGG